MKVSERKLDMNNKVEEETNRKRAWGAGAHLATCLENWICQEPKYNTFNRFQEKKTINQ